MKHCFILGTRPEIIKLSPLIRLAVARAYDFLIVHTNQHYTASMDQVFFHELKLPPADINLHIGSNEHSEQTGQMIISIGRILREQRPDVVYVEGDTNTVLAGAIAASKEPGVLLAHVEAGLRSYDRTMPEELNRIMADHVADFLFAPTNNQRDILLGEGIAREKIFVVGNSIVDAVQQNLHMAEQSVDPLKRFHLQSGGYALLTLHRPANVDRVDVLATLLKSINRLAADLPVLFPVHPRTKKTISQLRVPVHHQLTMIDPVGYLDMLLLMKHARYILTDSGGVQEEACVLQIPCLTLRDNTERPETVEVGGNVLVGNDETRLFSAIHRFNTTTIQWRNPFGDGQAAEKMIDVVTGHVAR